MDETDLYLTEERIRAVVRDAATFYKQARSRSGRMGPGGGEFLADSNRLLYLLNVLQKGTVEDAIAAQRRKLDGFISRIDPSVAEMMRGNQEMAEAQLRDIPQRELDAVMACLDEIETVYPLPVQAVRAKHIPAERDKLMKAATAVRTGDTARPQLTEERIRRVVDVLTAVVPGPKMLVRTLHEPGFVLESQTAAKMFPATTVKKIRAQGEDPEIFARDYAWLKIISNHISRGETIDERIAALIPAQSADTWIIAAHPPAQGRERAERVASALARPLQLLSRVGREEEAAVKSLLDEIMPKLRALGQLQIATNQESARAK